MSMTVRTAAAGAAMLVLLLLTPAVARSADRLEGFTVLLGFRYLDVDHRFRHDTHPDDVFLPNAATPGSAGTTRVGGAGFGFVGVGYQTFVFDNFSVNADLGALLGGHRDRKQNANDSRPEANGSFIYSEARFGSLAAAGGAYHLGGLFLGAEVQLPMLYVESGWDRFGRDEKKKSEFKVFPSVGPKVGYTFTKNIAAEATIQFGESLGGGINVRFGF